MSTKDEQARKVSALLRVCEDLRALNARHAKRRADAERDAIEAAVAAQLTPEEVAIVSATGATSLVPYFAAKREREYEEAVKVGLAPETVAEADDRGIPYSQFRDVVAIDGRMDALGLDDGAKTCIHTLVSNGAFFDVSGFFAEGEV